jgi:thiol-disulfide isomerase/thioredoxin
MGCISGLISYLSLVVFAMVNIGDKAPSFINQTQWIKGNAPVIGNSLIVVEIWKSSCSTCREQIPHLTALQKTYGNRISIVAINNEPVDVLNKFMKEYGNDVSYAIGRVPKDVMAGFSEGTPGAPYCYIIDKKGGVAWKGHPESIEDVLVKMLNGSLDTQKMKKVAALEKRLNEAYETNNILTITQALKALLAVDPSNFQALGTAVNIVRYNKDKVLLKEVFDKVPISDLSAKDADALAEMLVADSAPDSRYPEIAIKYSEYALGKDPKNGKYINDYARVLYSQGDLKQAIATQRMALELDPKNNVYKNNLDLYLVSQKTGAVVKLKNQGAR